MPGFLEAGTRHNPSSMPALLSDWDVFFGTPGSGGVMGTWRPLVATAATAAAWLVALRRLFPVANPFSVFPAQTTGVLLGTWALAYTVTPWLLVDDGEAERRGWTPHYTSQELRWTRFRPYDGGQRSLRGARVDASTGLPTESRGLATAGPGPGQGVRWYWDDNAIARSLWPEPSGRLDRVFALPGILGGRRARGSLGVI